MSSFSVFIVRLRDQTYSGEEGRSRRTTSDLSQETLLMMIIIDKICIITIGQNFI